MKNLTLTLLFGILIVSSISALSGGESETFSIDTTNTLFYDVVGNSSSIEGVNVTQEIFSNYSNITISLSLMIEQDSFTLVFFNDEVEEVIVTIPSQCSSCGGSGSSTIYKDRNLTKYVPVYVKEETNCTEPLIPKEDSRNIWKVLFIGLIIILAILVILMLVSFIRNDYIVKHQPT